MAATPLLAIALCMFSLAYPTTCVASYLIHLRNGRTVATTYYWRQGHTIMFYTPGGVVGLAESTVREIQMVEEPMESTVPRAAEREAAPVAAAPPAGQTARQSDLAASRKKKDQLQAQIDMALERYWAASSAHNAAEKVKLQHEITMWSKRLLDLLEEVKQKHQGRLPDGWEPLY